MTRSTCRVPLRGRSASSMRSVKMMRPTLSLFVIAENAKSAPSSAASVDFSCVTLPKIVEALASTISITVSSRSSA